MRTPVVLLAAAVLTAACASLPSARALRSCGGETPWPEAAPTPVQRDALDLVEPVLIRQTAPRYTREAMEQQIQGVVELEAVVTASGTVGAVRIVKSLDDRYGLDQAAVCAAKGWLFRPGEFEGRSVAVLVTLILEFRLH